MHFFIKNFKPQKHLGQNFLHSPTFARDLITKLSLPLTMPILEIGPGFGAFSNVLLSNQHHLTVIEKDTRLFNYLSQKLSSKNLVMFCADILKFDFRKLQADKYVVLSNLPYAIATRILKLLLNNYARFPHLFLAFPLDLGKRLLTLPNHTKANFLAIYCQIFCKKIEQIAFLSRTIFRPQPKIDSVFLHFVIRATPLLPARQFTSFVPFLKKAFRYKRKQLINNFPLEQRTIIQKFLKDCNLITTIRAEFLSIQQWIKLFNLLRSVS